MQTSVEWLVEELRQLAHNDKHHLGMGDIRITQGMLDDFYEQAKEVHKQEMIKFAINYTNDCGEFLMEKNVYEYYQETFKKD